MPSFLSERIKIIKVEDHTTAGTSAVESAGVDMDQSGGFGGVMFITSVGTPASNNTVNAQASDDDGSADDYGDITGTSVTSGSSDEEVYVDVKHPPKRWVRLEAARGTSTTLESIWAILYDPRSEPVDNTTSGTIAGEAHLAPAEGTA